MKKLFTLFYCVAFSLAASAQANTSKVTKIASPNAVKVSQLAVPEESLSLKESEFDFGKIPQGKPVTHIFEFTNIGKTPFALDKVQASCGCTTPEWNKDTIAPGQTAKITVGYNAANEGPFAKSVTISYNGSLTKQIIIKGEVWKTPVTSAPENAAVNSLKNEK
ncbi:MAG: DUF1573 domain-containing protein [Bacteroidota bacterium]|nr:DUF1573 domain-containing protein [Bacteroidota bacterium]